MAPGEERRSGEERRMNPPNTCTQPCIAIVAELNLRDDKMDKKLDALHKCLETKVPSKLFWKLAGGIATVVFIGIGGTLWSLKSEVSEVLTIQRVNAVSLKYTAESLKDHLIEARKEGTELERRVDMIEQGKTYYNFHNKDNKP